MPAQSGWPVEANKKVKKGLPIKTKAILSSERGGNLDCRDMSTVVTLAWDLKRYTVQKRKKKGNTV